MSEVARLLHLKFTLLEMSEKLPMWVILLVLLITPIGALPFASDMVGSVTAGVLDRYQSTCVYLLHTTHQQGECHHTVANTCHVMTVYEHNGRSCSLHAGLVSVPFLKTPALVALISGNVGILTVYCERTLLHSKYFVNKPVLYKIRYNYFLRNFLQINFH